MYRIAVRFIYFVDSISLKHLPPIRWLRRRKEMQSPRPNYTHNAIPIPTKVVDEILSAFSKFPQDVFDYRKDLDFLALAVSVQHQGQGNNLLATLAYIFLKADLPVQYLTASRHPIEFIGYLKRHLEANKLSWQDCTSKIVVIDAYSPHFAFTDSIYPKKDRELESWI